MQKITLILAMLLISVTANAASPVWNYVEVGYMQADIDDFDEFEPKGFSLEGAALLGENIVLNASYARLSEDVFGVDLDLNNASVGIGYRYGITQSTDVYTGLSYEYVEIEGSDGGQNESVDDNGYGLAVGIRSMITDALELGATIGYISIDGEGETSFGANADYFFTPNLSLGASYEIADDVSMLGANLRYAF